MKSPVRLVNVFRALPVSKMEHRLMNKTFTREYPGIELPVVIYILRFEIIPVSIHVIIFK
jgi:hypothetical protein